jgi:GTP diphosphokinase / guanosine-3',5'-bis(diphosphate) 3'-diphosphatase
MMRQYELVERVKAYDPDANEDLINRAYVYAMMAHGPQLRASGDPYFSHPLEVAGILTEMKLDTASICTALLHDVVEDTGKPLSEIEKLFGKEIARLVDGVTKLGKLELQEKGAEQAENFRKLLVAMSEDIRVLLVKLADRLHNMRTMEHIASEEKRRKKSRETLEIYAPLAERIGIHKVKDELEDLCFAHINPEARASIVSRLEQLRENGAQTVPKIIASLKDILAEGGLPNAEVFGREKRPYSIWGKMQKKDVTFEQLSDIMAFRIIVPDVGECYHALGIIHSHFPVVPGRFKDYISTSKPNGYRSLHTTVIGPLSQRVEIQIRTREMHEIAELGVAAHWGYKEGRPAGDHQQYRWLRELLDILDQSNKPDEFLEHTKLELFQDQVFTFTPKGAIVALPRGATLVDFAYAVHSAVGDHCVGAKVNGRMVPLRTVLRNGDQVEIITSKAQTPSPEWERFVITGKARARIRKYVRTQQRDQYAALGKAMLEKLFRQEGYEYTEKAVDGVLKVMKFEEVDDLLASIGSGFTTAHQVFNAVFPGHRWVDVETAKKKTTVARSPEQPVAIRGMIPGMAIHFARCCHPLPGDRIVGIVTTGKGVTVHTIDCETLESFAEAPERWLDIAWDNQVAANEVIGRINVTVSNEPGALGTIATVIGKNGGNISNLKFTNRSQDFFEMQIDIDVGDVKQLTDIMAALRATPVINAVERTRGQ